MTSPTPTHDSPDATLRWIHRATLAGIGVCALAIALQPGVEQEPAPARVHVYLGVAAALGTIVFRRFSESPVIGETTHRTLSILSWACALGLAITGLLVARESGGRQTGLVFALVAAVLSLRTLRRRTGAR